MATSITSPTYDPASTAAALADKYVAARRDILKSQTNLASATDKGLSTLSSAMLEFQSSLSSLTGLNKSIFAKAATFSDTTIGSAVADPTAAPGAYSFFVRQVAVASQMSYTGLTDDAGIGGTLGIHMGGAFAFNVNLGAADADANGTLSTRELAAAINSAAGNNSKVSAAIVTTGGTSELILTATNTGASSRITLDTSAVTGPSSLAAANGDPARVKELRVAQDAEIRVGSETGTAITQASNTFTNVDGVKMTFTKAQAPGATPVTLTVGTDESATIANVQKFVDAYNKLKSTVDGLVDAGDPGKSQAGGVFAHDGGIRALRDRMVSLLRPAAATTSLAAYGITATREGTLRLDSARLTRQLKVDPDGLDTLIGSSAVSNPSGIAGSFDTYLKAWSNTATGQINKRRTANDNLQESLTERQAMLDKQYDAAYRRYLLQFTQLQTIQSQMSSNNSLFDALFGNKSD